MMALPDFFACRGGEYVARSTVARITYDSEADVYRLYDTLGKELGLAESFPDLRRVIIPAPVGWTFWTVDFSAGHYTGSWRRNGTPVIGWSVSLDGSSAIQAVTPVGTLNLVNFAYPERYHAYYLVSPSAEGSRYVFRREGCGEELYGSLDDLDRAIEDFVREIEKVTDDEYS